jgi:hypothetical protein
VHQKRVLRGLFEPFAAELKAAFGFTDEDVIACVQAIEEFAENSFRRFQQNGKVIESQRKMDEHFAKFGDYLSFDAKDLTALNAVDVATNQAILDAFSLSRGEPDDHALIPSPFSALRERPILRLGDGRFVVPNQALLFPAVQSRVETMLNPALNPRAADGLWIRYQDHRGAWVEREAERLLRAMMPGGDGIVGGYYHVKINGPIEGHVRRQVESDVTYKVDDVLFLVEGKAGSFTPATFRGGAGSISRDVKDIITRGHDQCTRTEAYVRAGNRTLENHDGTPAFVISGAIREIFRIVVTLDNAGVLATATAMMKRAGYMAGEATWTLSLTDLMILSETLRRPGELRHYARRRYESMLHEHVLIFDETDSLGVYFLHNDTTIMHGEADTVMLSGYNDSLDAYYVTGEIAEPPCLEVPDEIVSLVDALAKRAAPLWSEAVCDLFALGKTLRDVAEAIAERIETDKPRDFTLGLEGGGALTVLIMPGTDPAMLLEAFISGLASSPNKPVGKRLFIGYDPASGIAQAQYRQRVDDRYFFVPPALTWISSLTNR